MNCRYCRSTLEHIFLDLGRAPPSNAYRDQACLNSPELSFPLKLRICARCWLAQTEDYVRADDLFDSAYAYFSSTSQTWLDHGKRFFEAARALFELNERSFVIEIASNDGYLLRHFVKAGIPCLGIEPTASTGAAAKALGIPVHQAFFGQALGNALAREGRCADLIVGNNVYAHVPDINDFTAGLKALLNPGGTITLEFPHLMRMIEGAQFDTVYHEHFSYLSLYTASRIFSEFGLRIFDVEELATHGGSLRVFGCHTDDSRENSPAVAKMLEAEAQSGLRTLQPYITFQARAERIKDDLLIFLIEQKRSGRLVAAYGAAAKGNTLLNFAGVKTDLVPYVCDTATSKQGKYMPGSGIPILPPSALRENRPDTVLILPWNIADEVMTQNRWIREWGGKFVVAVPRLEILDA